MGEIVFGAPTFEPLTNKKLYFFFFGNSQRNSLEICQLNHKYLVFKVIVIREEVVDGAQTRVCYDGHRLSVKKNLVIPTDIVIIY